VERAAQVSQQVRFPKKWLFELLCSCILFFFFFFFFFFLNNKFITFKSGIITVLATISSHLLLISFVESVPSKRTGPAREIFKSYVHSISVTKQL